ncbi:MAG: NAD(P)/FAD-dependent oxidoreductase [Ardenticatenaceae bacterium]
MKIAIIGAGYAGMTAGYDLGKAGHAVTIYEALPEAGGLAAGFKAPHWAWRLEKFYHHLFTNDDQIINLAKEIGIGEKLRAYRPSTDLVFEGNPYPFDHLLPVLRYPGLSFAEKMRAGLTVSYLKLQRNWSHFDKVTAHEWMKRVMGSAYENQFEPLLRGKFGEENYRQVPMTWFWARLYKRTPRLIYPDGGFQTITDAMVQAVERSGGQILLNTPVRAMEQEDGGWVVTSKNGTTYYDCVIATVSPALLTRLVPDLSDNYLAALRDLKHMGAVVMTVALSQPLTKKSYWLNLDKRKYPMLSLVEHTNMADPKHYGGDHLIYMGDYLPPDHPYLSYSADELFEVYEPSMKSFNPTYDRSWVRNKWIFSTKYAQPLPTVDYNERIPPLKTPLGGLYFASMSQVYPWDRGTNYAVDIGHKVAAELLRFETL